MTISWIELQKCKQQFGVPMCIINKTISDEIHCATIYSWVQHRYNTSNTRYQIGRKNKRYLLIECISCLVLH